MKCPTCQTEMFINQVTVDKDKGTETFIYKCPNPNCSNYGYKTKES